MLDEASETIEQAKENFIENISVFYYEDSSYLLKDENEKFGAYPGEFKINRVIQGQSAKPYQIENDIQKVNAKKTIVLSDFSLPYLDIEAFGKTIRSLVMYLIKKGFDVRFWDGEKAVKFDSIETQENFDKKIKSLRAVSDKQLKDKLAEEGIFGDAIFNMDYFELRKIARSKDFSFFGCWYPQGDNKDNTFDIQDYYIRDMEEKIKIEEWLLEKKEVILYFKKDSISNDDNKIDRVKNSMAFLIEKMPYVFSGIQFEQINIVQDKHLLHSLKKIKNLKKFIWREAQSNLNDSQTGWEKITYRIKLPDWSLEEIDIANSDMPADFFNQLTRKNTKLKIIRLSSCKNIPIYACLQQHISGSLNYSLKKLNETLEVKDRIDLSDEEDYSNEEENYQFYQLEELYITNMTIEFSHFWMGFSSVWQHSLKKLTLNHVISKNSDKDESKVPEREYCMESLKEFNCIYSEGKEHVEKIINSAPNLESLSVKNKSKNENSQIKIINKLKTLKVLCTDELTLPPIEFQKILVTTNNIEKLEYFNYQDEKNFVPEGVSFSRLQSVSKILINSNHLSVIAKSPLITILELKGERGWYSNMENILNISDFSHIKNIFLNQCRISSGALGLLLRKTPNIEHIVIEGCENLSRFSQNNFGSAYALPKLHTIIIRGSRINMREIEKIIQKSPLLRIVELDMNYFEDSKAVFDLNSLTHLKTLHRFKLNFSRGIVSVSFSEYLSLLVANKELNIIDFGYLENADDLSTDINLSAAEALSKVKEIVVRDEMEFKWMKKTLPFLKNLENLTLYNCNFNHDDDFPENLFFPKLKIINMSGINFNSDVALINILKASASSICDLILIDVWLNDKFPMESIKKLQFAQLKEVSCYTASGLFPYGHLKIYLKTKCLTELKLDDDKFSKELKETTFADWMTFEKIESLEVCDIAITGEVFLNILKHLPNLKHLKLMAPDQSDLPVAQLAPYLKNIESLSVQVENMSELCLEELILACRKKLKNLNVTETEGIRSNGECDYFIIGEEMFDALESIQIIGCFSGVSVYHIILSAENLKSIYIKNVFIETYPDFYLDIYDVQHTKLESLELIDVEFSYNMTNMLLTGQKNNLKKIRFVDSDLDFPDNEDTKGKIKNFSIPNLRSIELSNITIDNGLFNQFLYSIETLISHQLIVDYNRGGNKYQYSPYGIIMPINGRVDSVLISHECIAVISFLTILRKLSYTSALTFANCSYPLSWFTFPSDEADICISFSACQPHRYLRKLTFIGSVVPQNFICFVMGIAPNLESIELINVVVVQDDPSTLIKFIEIKKQEKLISPLSVIRINNSILPKSFEHTVKSLTRDLTIIHDESQKSAQDSPIKEIKYSSEPGDAYEADLHEEKLSENSLSAENLFTPDVHPSEYRLGVFKIDENNFDSPGASIKLIPTTVDEKNLVDVKIKIEKSISEIKKSYQHFLENNTNKNIQYKLCQTPLIITSEWQPLPSHLIDENIESLYTDFQNPYQIKYSETDNLYYIRSDKPHYYESKISTIIKNNFKHQKGNINFPDEIQKIIKKAAGFQYQGDSKFELKKDATPREALEARIEQQVGKCDIRSFSCYYALKKCFRSDPKKYADYDVRITKNKIHAYVEVKDKSGWTKINLGGYPASLDLKTINFEEEKITPKAVVDNIINNQAKSNSNSNTHSSSNSKSVAKNSTPQASQSKSQWLTEALQPSRNSLVLCDEKKDCLKIIAEIYQETKIPYFLIDSPEDLQWHSEGLKFEDASDILKVIKNQTALRDFIEQYRKTKKGILFINWNNFSDAEKTTLHCIIDSNRLLEGEKFEKTIPIVSFSCKKEGEELEDDFESRHHPEQIITHDKFDKNVDVYFGCCQKLDFKNSTLLSEEIDLFESDDWESLLWGKISLLKNQFVYQFEKIPEDNSIKIPTLYLKNCPWHLREFQLFWQKALQQKEFKLYGRDFKLAADFHLYHDAGYEPDCANVFVDASSSNNTNAKFFPLNLNTYHQFFPHESSNGIQYATSDGKLSENKGKTIKVVLTQALSYSQWCRLLKTAKESQVKIELQLCENVSLPKEFSTANIPTTLFKPECTEIKKIADLKNLINKPYSIIQSPKENHKILIPALLKKFENTLYIDLDASHHFGTLFYKNLAELTPQGILTTFIESDAFKALQNGQDVIINGTLPQHLVNALSEFFISGKPELMVNGKLVNLKGKLIIIGDNSIVFSQNVFIDKIKLKHQKNIQKDSESESDSGEEKESQINKNKKDISEKSFKDYEKRRFNRLKKAFDKNPIVYYQGKTGVGKSTYILEEFEQDYYHRTGRKAKLYKGEEALDAYGAHIDPTADAFLFIDEANCSPMRLSLLKGVKSLYKKHLLTENHYYDFEKNKKVNKFVLLAGNDLSYGGARLKEQQDFIDESAEIVECEDPNHAFFYHKILKPKNVPEDEAKIILDIFDEINAIAVRQGYLETNGPFLSQRHLKVMAMMFSVFKSHHKDSNINDKWRAVMSCLSVLGDRLNPKAQDEFNVFLQKKYQFNFEDALSYQEKFIEKKIQEKSQQKLNHNFVFMKSHYRFLFVLELFLSMPDDDICDFGLLLEGGSGFGKSKVAKQYLKLMDHDFVQFSWSKNFENDKKALLEFFDTGKKVIIDEFNAGGSRHEKLLNRLMMGLDENGRKAKIPGFRLILTQNPMTKKGRRPLTPAQMARVTPIRASAPTSDDLMLMATRMAKKMAKKSSVKIQSTELQEVVKKHEDDSALFVAQGRNPLNLRHLKTAVESLIKEKKIEKEKSEKRQKIIDEIFQSDSCYQKLLSIDESDESDAEYLEIINTLKENIVQKKFSQFVSTVDDLYFHERINFVSYVHLSRLSKETQGSFVARDVFKKTIQSYHQEKGGFRKFFDSSTKTIEDLESVLSIAESEQSDRVPETDIECVLRQRDKRECATRNGLYKNNFLNFFQSSAMAPSSSGGAESLSQTESVLMKLRSSLKH